MRLLFDEMLHRLCSWARILGIDSEFVSGKTDSEILAAMPEGRLFITRDVPLAARCRKRGIRHVLIKSDAIEEQLAQLLDEAGWTDAAPEKARCASCNGGLLPVPKESVEDAVPLRVFEKNERFWRCAHCGRVFWEGGHWKNIRAVFDNALRAAGKNGPATA